MKPGQDLGTGHWQGPFSPEKEPVGISTEAYDSCSLLLLTRTWVSRHAVGLHICAFRENRTLSSANEILPPGTELGPTISNHQQVSLVRIKLQIVILIHLITMSGFFPLPAWAQHTERNSAQI